MDSETFSGQVPIKLSVCGESWVSLGSKCPAPRNQILVKGVADTWCSVLCGGIDIWRKFKAKQSQLLKSKVMLRVADGRQLTVIRCLPVDVSVAGSPKKTKQQAKPKHTALASARRV